VNARPDKSKPVTKSLKQMQDETPRDQKTQTSFANFINFMQYSSL